MDTRPGHEFQPPSVGAGRCPCPALNAAANHGYLAHSGKNITFLQLTRMLHDLYGLSWLFAALLTLGAIIRCGSRGKLDLDALAVHNKIEHDASLVHDDFREGDNNKVNPQLVEELIAQSSDGKGLTMGDFARTRVKREARPGVQLDRLHALLGLGECLLVLGTMGYGKAVPLETVKVWFGEERLPSGWVPKVKLGLVKVLIQIPIFGRLMRQAKRSE